MEGPWCQWCWRQCWRAPWTFWHGRGHVSLHLRVRIAFHTWYGGECICQSWCVWKDEDRWVSVISNSQRVNTMVEFICKWKGRLKRNRERRNVTSRSGNSALPLHRFSSPPIAVPTTISWKSRMYGSPCSMTYLLHHLQSPRCISPRIPITSGTFQELQSGKPFFFCNHQSRLISLTIQVVGWFYFARSMRKQGFRDFWIVSPKYLCFRSQFAYRGFSISQLALPAKVGPFSFTKWPRPS